MLPSKKQKISIARRVLGSLLLAIGICTLVIPVFPSFLLIIAGAYLLDLKWVKEKIHFLKKKWKERRFLKKHTRTKDKTTKK